MLTVTSDFILSAGDFLAIMSYFYFSSWNVIFQIPVSSGDLAIMVKWFNW